MKSSRFVAAALLSATFSASASAEVLWGVNVTAAGSDAIAEEFSLGGAVLRQVDLGAGIDPRGIAIVGRTAYFTDLNATLIRSFNIDTGVVSSATIATGGHHLGALSSDATGLWATDYDGGNQAYHFNLGAGVIDKTLALSRCGSYCNGLEALPNGQLVANEGETEASATYDLYNSDGTLAQAGLITGVTDGAGLVYDQINGLFYISSALDNSVLSYNGGTPAGAITLGDPLPDTGFGGRVIGDLAAVGVPEPATIALLAGAVAGLGAIRRRR